MKIETLKERIEKKNAMIEKKQNTIEKKTKQIEKKSEQVKNMGYNPDGDKYQAYETEDHTELYWKMCEIEGLKDDIRRLTVEIEESKETLDKYWKQLEGEMEKERTFLNEVPENVKEMEQMLIEKWDESQKNRREYLREQYKELGYDEFIRKYRHTGYEYQFITDEQIHNANVRDARTFVLDLLNRTKEITGEVTSWCDVHLTVGTNGYPVLNGYVEGKEGRAEVESIYAGGYNIQRLHVRVLVKAC